MSPILTGAGGEIWFDIFHWPRVLLLAGMYGWESKGTNPSSQDPHYDGYVASENQKVLPLDSRNLAAALERALPDIPEEDLLDGEKPMDLDIEDVAPLDLHAELMEYFSGKEGREEIRAFIDFCQAGEFYIG